MYVDSKVMNFVIPDISLVANLNTLGSSTESEYPHLYQFLIAVRPSIPPRYPSTAELNPENGLISTLIILIDTLMPIGLIPLWRGVYVHHNTRLGVILLLLIWIFTVLGFGD